MANTAGTQEPTMEEILASIRRIISEDGDEAKPAAAPAPESPKAKSAAPAAAPVAAAKAPKLAPPPVVEVEDVEEVDDVLELTEIVPEEELPSPETPAEDDVVMVERAPPPLKSAPRAPVIASRPRPQAAEPDEGLLSEEVRTQASSSFMQLARTTMVTDQPHSDGRSLEGLVQDMLRPMLEDWLNHNLPEIVDRLVQQEIDRVSRKTGR